MTSLTKMVLRQVYYCIPYIQEAGRDVKMNRNMRNTFKISSKT